MSVFDVLGPEILVKISSKMTKNTPISDIWVHVRIIFGVVRVSMDATSPMQRLEGVCPKIVRKYVSKYVPIFSHYGE